MRVTPKRNSNAHGNTNLMSSRFLVRAYHSSESEERNVSPTSVRPSQQMAPLPNQSSRDAVFRKTEISFLRATLCRMRDLNTEPNRRAVSRRQFGRRATLAAAAGTLSSSALLAQPASSPASLPPTDQGAVNVKYANIIRKYGDRLSPAQRRRARETLVQHQRMLMRIREFALDNRDAPATGLRLYPSDIQPASGSVRERPH